MPYPKASVNKTKGHLGWIAGNTGSKDNTPFKSLKAFNEMGVQSAFLGCLFHMSFVRGATLAAKQGMNCLH